jgi:hypothetical protein
MEVSRGRSYLVAYGVVTVYVIGCTETAITRQSALDGRWISAASFSLLQEFKQLGNNNASTGHVTFI